MSRNTTLSAFLLVFAVLVPAGWRGLRADLQTDGKRLRPLQESFTTSDGTRVTLDVDRSVILTGDSVTATVVAYADATRPVSVDLLALHTNNYGGERVEQPWRRIDRETLHLTAAPGGGPPVSTRIQLGERPASVALADSFQIYVTEHGRKPPRRESSDIEPYDYDTGPSEGYAAATRISGWSGDSLSMSFAPEGKATINTPFIVAVKIKNTAGIALTQLPYVQLTTSDALKGTDWQAQPSAAQPAAQPDGDKPSAVEIEPLETDAEQPEGAALARGATLVRRFRVTVHQPDLKSLTLLASAMAYNEQPGPLTAGAEDARTFKLTAPAPEAAPAMAANEPAARRAPAPTMAAK